MPNNIETVREMIFNSILMDDNRKRELLTLLPSLSEEKLLNLKVILEEETQGIKKILMKKFKNDPEGKYMQEFEAFQRKTDKHFREKAEAESRREELEKIKTLDK